MRAVERSDAGKGKDAGELAGAGYLALFPGFAALALGVACSVLLLSAITFQCLYRSGRYRARWSR